MHGARAVGLVLALAVLITACSRPVSPPEPSAPVHAPSRPAEDTVPVHDPSAKTPPVSHSGRVAVQFQLYEGPLGFRVPDKRKNLLPGDSARIGTAAFTLDILLPDVEEAAARQGLRVKGTTLLSEPKWIAGQGVALTVAAGRAGDQITVTVSLKGEQPAVLQLTRVGWATVTAEYRFEQQWRPISRLDSHVEPGAAELRLRFSKPVRQVEVEQALTAAQASPVRGLMQWEDDRTLLWQIVALPPRLDFFLGGAHDQDGMELPGGIPSLRTGTAPMLITTDITKLSGDRELTLIPPDVQSAALTADRAFLNLVSWIPGVTPWDWQATDLYVDLKTGTLKPGRVEGTQPRLSGELQAWVVNPGGTLVAGLRPASQTGAAQSGLKDLVIRDLRGGREQIVRAFATQVAAPEDAIYLVWSPDGARVALLTDSDPPGPGAAIVALELATGERTVLASGLPLRAAGAPLVWSQDGRYVLAGNVLADLMADSARVLPGEPTEVRGAFEPQGTRLLYSFKDWEQVAVIAPATGEQTPLGTGLMVGWAERDRAYLIRWGASDTRYSPPGQ